MKKNTGFTLMEILAVLLVIAVIASFAVPLIKSVREEIRYQKAKAAAVQLAEAVRSFYTDSKGCLTFDQNPEEGFFGADAASGTCPNNSPIKTGLPFCGTEGKARPKDIFDCGYISPKMFVDLPYTFTVFDPRNETGVFVIGSGEGDRSFTVNRDMTISEEDD